MGRGSNFWTELGDVYNAFVESVVRRYAVGDKALAEEVEADIAERMIDMVQELDRKYIGRKPRIARFGELNEDSSSGDVRAMDRTYQLNLLINRLYTASRPFTTRIYSDSGWQNVYKHLAAIEGVRGVLEVDCSSGQYCNYVACRSLDINHPAYREYTMTIKTEWGDIEGRLICHSAGSQDDVFSSYDMTCTFWRKEDAR